ncbi:MAG: pyrroline-5-carboxylate reductase [Oscillospiraceae bacterium]|nr:pyrroline-5-carboxylate reductase [Oscillospiraceae bacterium]
MNKIGFIGAGNMGSAIMKGIAKSGMNDNCEIFAFDMDAEKVSSLSEYGVKKAESADEICDICDIVFLAVKPQVFEDVLVSIREHARTETVFVSIAAGITAEFIRKSLGKDEAKVVLVMPNTPLLLGEGATAVGHAENVPQDKFALVCDIFSECGKVAVIPENKMKEVIALNGSSPAFIYLYAKGFIDYGKKAGFDEETSKALFAQSLIGSAKMITDSGYSIDELIKMVSSPGGTTLAGLDRLYEGKLTEVADNACQACTKRAYELSK